MTKAEQRAAPEAMSDGGGRSDLLGSGFDTDDIGHESDGTSFELLSPFAATAVEYLRKGWFPFPLPAKQKSPPPTNRTGRGKLIPSRPDVQAWIDFPKHDQANIGITIPDGVIALDVDDYDGKSGGATLDGKTAEWGSLPPTWISTSRAGRSGIRWYRVPSGLTFLGGLPGIDLITHYHRYAVAPPSVHPSNGIYRWIAPDGTEGDIPKLGDLPPLPEQWIDGLLSTVRRDNGNRRAGLPGGWVDWLERLPGASDQPCVHMSNALALAAPGNANGSRHDHSNQVGQLGLLRAAEAGHPGVIGALLVQRDEFVKAVDDTRTEPAEQEWLRGIRGACKIVADDPWVLPSMARGAPCVVAHDDQSSGAITRDQAGEPLSDGPGAVDGGLLARQQDFWDSREGLGRIRDFARSRLVSPWAVLGCVLARTLCTVPPHVVLPPIVGTTASLNVFVGLVGPSGIGKGGAHGAALDAVQLPADVFSISPGSGEGLVHQYRRWTKEDPQEIVRESVLFTVSEVDTLVALGGRKGATLLSQLRAAWSGESLGHGFVDQTKAIVLPAHSYRLCLIIGVQPGRAGALLDDAEGGTPQRILWMPSTDPDAPDECPPQPEPLVLKTQEWPLASLRLSVPEPVQNEIREAQRANLRGESTDRYSGHLRLSRLKVAQGLAFLAGRRVMTVDDWNLAGIVIDTSEATRIGVLRELKKNATRESQGRGHQEAVRVLAAEDTVAREKTTRLCELMLAKIPAAGISRSDLRRQARKDSRPFFDGAMAALTNAGQVIETTTPKGRLFTRKASPR